MNQLPNTLYLSDRLLKQFPEIFGEVKYQCECLGIPLHLISSTKDIWLKDFMSIQISPSEFVQFIYNPCYLRNTKAGRNSITNLNEVTPQLGITISPSDLLFEGGNFSRLGNQAIVCDRVFQENPQKSEDEIIKQLMQELSLEKLTVVPSNKNDFTGHVDGMLRLISESVVLINDYSQEDQSFQFAFRSSLRNAGYSLITMPYNPYGNKSYDWAIGEYLNYLLFEQGILFPIFNLPEDQQALDKIETIYPDKPIKPVNCVELAKLGGALNCIGWNIFKTL